MIRMQCRSNNAPHLSMMHKPRWPHKHVIHVQAVNEYSKQGWAQRTALLAKLTPSSLQEAEYAPSKPVRLTRQCVSLYIDCTALRKRGCSCSCPKPNLLQDLDVPQQWSWHRVICSCKIQKTCIQRQALAMTIFNQSKCTHMGTDSGTRRKLCCKY